MIMFSNFSSKQYVVSPHLNYLVETVNHNVVAPHLNCLIETVQMRGHNILFYSE